MTQALPEVDVSSSFVKANLGFRLLLEIGLLAGIVVASVQNYDGATVWIASIIGVTVAASLWGVFAVPNDPSRSGKTVVATPGVVRLVIELALFALVTAWLATAESYVFAALLGGGAIVHYAAWPARIRWLLAH